MILVYLKWIEDRQSIKPHLCPYTDSHAQRRLTKAVYIIEKKGFCFFSHSLFMSDSSLGLHAHYYVAGKKKKRSNRFDNSTENTRDCVENKLNMITKTAPPIPLVARIDGATYVWGRCEAMEGWGVGGVRQQLWFPSISFLGGLPGQMGWHDVTCVKCNCLLPVFYLTLFKCAV